MRDYLKLLGVDDILKVRKAPAQVRIVVLIDEPEYVFRLYPGLQDLQHHDTELRAASPIYQNRLIAVHYEIGVTVQIPFAVNVAYPVYFLGNLYRLIV
jgi:hypothetical protein